jgi:peptidoglycan hydrolase-like amidase
MAGSSCIASQNGQDIATGGVRIDPRGGISTISSWTQTSNRYRGILECRVLDGHLALINEISLEDYMAGLSEEPDTEPAAKQMAFAIAARSYAAYYRDPGHRKFPGQPYDGSDDPAIFQKYDGVAFEDRNPRWVSIVRNTAGEILKSGNEILKVPYFSSDDGRTRSPAEVGWTTFPHPEIFSSKPDPWCKGMENRGHGVGMSGCGAKGQAYEGKTAEQILQYYYPGAAISKISL